MWPGLSMCVCVCVCVCVCSQPACLIWLTPVLKAAPAVLCPGVTGVHHHGSVCTCAHVCWEALVLTLRNHGMPCFGHICDKQSVLTWWPLLSLLLLYHSLATISNPQSSKAARLLQSAASSLRSKVHPLRREAFKVCVDVECAPAECIFITRHRWVVDRAQGVALLPCRFGSFGHRTVMMTSVSQGY
jgi:hypothetical protein